MASKSHASLEARLENNIALYLHLETLSNYNPTAADLKAAAIKTFITTKVQPAMPPYLLAKSELNISQGNCDVIFDKIHDIAIEVRSETFESFFGSDFYKDVNHLVRLITGENVSRYSASHPKKTDDPATSENEAEWTSVSQLDRASRLGNFVALINLLTAKGDYDPEDPDLKIPKLQLLADDAQTALNDLATKGTTFTNQRAIILKFFDGPGGLSEIAARAKRNVKRNYGAESPEYKALVNKAY